MSGWIRVKELPTRYEVRREPFPPHHYKDAESARQGQRLLKRILSDWKAESGPAKLVTIRRHQVKRTVVVEECNLQRTSWAKNCYLANLIASVFVGMSKQSEWNPAWYLELYAAGERPVPCSFGTREEAEAAARKWLRDNGYRIRKVAI